jgi:hypothetical protein
MRRIVVLFLFCAILPVCGCKAKKWTNDQFEGTWQVEKGELAAEQTAAGATTILLEHDGRFVANALPPGFLRLEGVKADQVLSGRGTWSLRQYKDEQRLLLTFTSIERSNVRELPYGAELFIDSSSGNCQLFYYQGDPDEEHRIVFKRE